MDLREKPKPVDSTLCPGKGFLPFRVGLDRGVNRTLGPEGPFLLSSYFGSTISYFGSTLYNTDLPPASVPDLP